GAMHLIRTWIVHPCSIEATWIVKDYEDNLYLSDTFGYQVKKEDFKKEWFTLGGFSQQPFLLCNQYPYLQRGEINHYLRAVINAFSVNCRNDTVSFCEHPLPTIMDVRGDFFKPSDEANFCGCLRDMLVLEVNKNVFMEHLGKENHDFTKRSRAQFEKYGESGGWENLDAIALFQGTPREWAHHGKEIHVKRLPTQFGLVSADLVSHVDDGYVRVSCFIEKREDILPWHDLAGFFVTTRLLDKEKNIIDVQVNVSIDGTAIGASHVPSAVVKHQSIFVDIGKRTWQWDALTMDFDIIIEKNIKPGSNDLFGQ
nr:hypothetical protein [Candidatus Sigynarchaeota archaeon]